MLLILEINEFTKLKRKMFLFIILLEIIYKENIRKNSSKRINELQIWDL